MICANVLNTRLIFVLRHAKLRAHAHLAKCFSQNHLYSEQLYGPYCSIPMVCRILGDSVLGGFLRFGENCRQYGNSPEPSWSGTAMPGSFGQIVENYRIPPCCAYREAITQCHLSGYAHLLTSETPWGKDD